MVLPELLRGKPYNVLTQHSYTGADQRNNPKFPNFRYKGLLLNQWKRAKTPKSTFKANWCIVLRDDSNYDKCFILCKKRSLMR